LMFMCKEGRSSQCAVLRHHAWWGERRGGGVGVEGWGGRVQGQGSVGRRPAQHLTDLAARLQGGARDLKERKIHGRGSAASPPHRVLQTAAALWPR
jgi:hypothetical protein